MATRSTTLDAADRPVVADLLDRPVAGFGIDGSQTLRSVLGDDGGLTLLVFLRHFG